MRRWQTAVRLAACCGVLCVGAPPAIAGGLVLPYPPVFGVFPANTFDPDGKRVGGATLTLVERGEGSVHMALETGMEGGPGTRAEADLAVTEDGRGVRLLRERSESHNEAGESLGVLVVDHERGIGTCTPPNGGKTHTIQLPEDERVVNVPLNLLFLPLVQGTAKNVDFQLFLCRMGARVVNFKARVGEGSRNGGDRRIIEVTYGPDLGGMVSWLAGRLVPKLSFWFEANSEGTYLAHRMPLFSKGPEVFIVREGLTPGVFVPGP